MARVGDIGASYDAPDVPFPQTIDYEDGTDACTGLYTCECERCRDCEPELRGVTPLRPDVLIVASALVWCVILGVVWVVREIAQ